jgi:hypothetical protein
MMGENPIGAYLDVTGGSCVVSAVCPAKLACVGCVRVRSLIPRKKINY